MRTLTLLQYATLMAIKAGSRLSTKSPAVVGLISIGLLKEQDGIVRISTGEQYNYRGNTYTL